MCLKTFRILFVDVKAFCNSTFNMLGTEKLSCLRKTPWMNLHVVPPDYKSCQMCPKRQNFVTHSPFCVGLTSSKANIQDRILLVWFFSTSKMLVHIHLQTILLCSNSAPLATSMKPFLYENLIWSTDKPRHCRWFNYYTWTGSSFIGEFVPTMERTNVSFKISCKIM